LAGEFFSYRVYDGIGDTSAFMLDKCRRFNMDKRFGYYVLLGLLIGNVFGLGYAAANGNTFLGLWMGALIGVFTGWFLAAANLVHR
jgi:hypothetical protein